MNLTPITLGLSLLAAPLVAQQTQFGGTPNILGTLPGGAERAHFGEQVVVIGDVNLDGIPDFAISTSPTGSLGPTDIGRVQLFSGADNSLIFSWIGAAQIDQFGSNIAAAGDVNADGVPDLIISSPNAAVNGVVFTGSAFVYSGADGSELYRFDGEEIADRYAERVAGAGDYNNDGYDDLLVSAPYKATFFQAAEAGFVYVYSGFDGSTLNIYRGNPGDRLGTALAGAGDLNGDGFDDILMTAEEFSIPGSYGSGGVFAYSGADRSLIHAFAGSAGESYFGYEIASIADLDADGTPDILVSTGENDEGRVRAYSGANGERLLIIQQLHEDSLFGSALADAGDVDGDGIHDILVGAAWQDSVVGNDAGAAFVYSGADGHRILDFEGAVDHMEVGSAVSALGDIDGDGVVEFLVAARNADSAFGARSGIVQVVNFSPFLSADATTLSLSGASTLTLDLEFPDSEGGMDYQVLASLRGTTPGLVDGIGVPLTQDSLFQFLQQGAAPTGTLNAQGDATLTLASPRFVPGLIGRQLSIATVSMDSVAGTARLSSVARTVTLTP